MNSRSQVVEGAGGGKKCVAKTVMVEETVQITSEDETAGGSASVEKASLIVFRSELREGLCTFEITGLANVNLLAADV